MTVLNDLMQDIQHAYHAGKAGIGTPYDEDRPEILEQIQQWDYGILPQEMLVKDLCFELLRTAIKMISQREFANAEGLIHTMYGLIESSDLSRDSRSFCKSYIEAAAAYLEYKCQRYDRAMERLCEALAIDEQLEQHNPKFRHMHLHRMMLLDNWVRVLARRGQACASLGLAFQVLDYLEGKIPSLPVPTTWDSSLLSPYPADILSGFFRMMTSQIAEVITGMDRIEDTGEVIYVRDAFARIHHHLSPDDSTCCHLSPASHDWIRMKQAALDDNLPVCLQHATRLLASGPGRLPTLWYATIVEVIILCQRWPTHRSRVFHEELSQEVVAWRRLPPAWKAAIS